MLGLIFVARFQNKVTPYDTFFVGVAARALTLANTCENVWFDANESKSGNKQVAWADPACRTQFEFVHPGFVVLTLKIVILRGKVETWTPETKTHNCEPAEIRAWSVLMVKTMALVFEVFTIARKEDVWTVMGTFELKFAGRSITIDERGLKLLFILKETLKDANTPM